ncbi:hypothetical protein RJ639_017692 [Escallonia herrerae]|uniref:Integrase catalytic domain-containing protein n=1 Tax=Escallonia herrerae TaxID=1293975 RepID=A0AA88VEA6_9ASTE|nr:hypothetical protein RJ639_017692 [Escallonia herrerae]
MALELKILSLAVSGNSKLVINQLLKEYEVKNEDIVPYFRYATILINKFDSVELEHVPREENYRADALASLATTLALRGEDKVDIPVCQQWVLPKLLDCRIEETDAISVRVIEAEDWRDDEAAQATDEAHSGVCGAHQSDAWRLDVAGPLPKSSGGHFYILVATNYFSKWAEAASLKEVKKETMENFIKNNLIFRYDVPCYIITDNGKPFYNTLMDQLCTKFGFKQHNSSMYNAPANGLAAAFNKTLCNLFKKVVAKSKKDWHEKIGEALRAYRTTYHTPTQVTPYSLVYGVEAVLPLEQQIPSLRIAIQEGLISEDNAQLRLEELEALDEKRLESQQRLDCYQTRLSKAFNKRVRPWSITISDLVLAIQRPIITIHCKGNKFTSKWDDPMW